MFVGSVSPPLHIVGPAGGRSFVKPGRACAFGASGASRRRLSISCRPPFCQKENAMKAFAALVAAAGLLLAADRADDPRKKDLEKLQ